jgi:hypothetical protein
LSDIDLQVTTPIQMGILTTLNYHESDVTSRDVPEWWIWAHLLGNTNLPT